MRIGRKITLYYCIMALMLLLAAFIALFTSAQSLKKTIADNSIIQAKDILDDVNKSIDRKIEEFRIYIQSASLQKALVQSNARFSQMPDREKYIQEADRAWKNTPKDQTLPIIDSLLSNELSREMNRRIKFYDEKYRYSVIGEIFFTNAYGVNVAQSGRTTDYYQADESWWQRAKKDGIYVSDVIYDESADVYSTDICLRIESSTGKFIGVFKGVLNIESIRNIIAEAYKQSSFKSMVTYLIDKNGRVIFAGTNPQRADKRAAVNYKFGDNISTRLSVQKTLKGAEGALIGRSMNRPVLTAFVHSQGFGDFSGLDWSIVLDYDLKEIYYPVYLLRNNLLIAAGLIAFLAVLVAFGLYKSIVAPVSQLSAFAREIRNGNLKYRVKISSRDEFGDLAKLLNNMAVDLRRLIDQEKGFANQERLRAEELSTAYKLVREAQIKLVRSEKLNAVGQLAAGVAHEINSPITGLVGLLRMMAKNAPQETEEHKKLKMMTDAAEHIMSVTTGLSSFSKTSSGTREYINVNEAIDSTLSFSIYLIRKNKINLIRTYAENLPLIYAEKSKIQQVILNLISNACEAMDEHGTLELKTYAEGEKVAIDFKDNGPGISPENIEKIFAPFYTTKTEHKDIGLGLVISSDIVQSYGGTITVTSTPGCGATFKVTFDQAPQRLNV